MENIYRNAASQILNMVRNLNRTQHVYKEVESSTFNNVSHAFYNKYQKELERLGFVKILDIEDISLRGLRYVKPTFMMQSPGVSDRGLGIGMWCDKLRR